MDQTLARLLADLTASSTKPEIPPVDVMMGDERRTVYVLDHGFVSLLDVTPRLVPPGQTADSRVVQAARVSYGAGTKKLREDAALLRYLMRHDHATPFEMVQMTFHLALPLFVAAQLVRHRTAKLNAISGRYTELKDVFYHPSPENIRQQSLTNRQGGEDPVDEETAKAFLAYLEQSEASYVLYKDLLRRGVARELARIGLPQTLYTEWYWTCDLRNIFNMLRLRMDSHAQWEIRQYAFAMFALIQPIVPVSCQAFLDYQYGGMKLTSLEIEALRTGQPLATDSKGELAEWESKKATLGLSDGPLRARILTG